MDGVFFLKIYVLSYVLFDYLIYFLLVPNKDLAPSSGRQSKEQVIS